MQEQECNPQRRAADDKGVALLVVLAVVAILAVVIFDFSFSVRVDMHIAANFRDRLVALEAAKAGVNYGIHLLRQDDPGRDNLQEDWAQLNGIVLDKTDPDEIAERVNMSEEELTLDKHEDFLARQKGGNVPTASIVIYDEERKINVNLLGGSLGAQGRRGAANPLHREWVLTLLENLEYPDVDPYELVENITDWVDPDDDGNAEYHYYESLPEPYSCRNDQMESIYELKLVKGMTDLVFFGDTPYPMQLTGLEDEQWEERERLGFTLPETAPWEREEGLEATYGLINFLTAYSNGRINLFTAPREVLMAVFENDDFVADTIIEAREESASQPKEIQTIVLQVSPALYNILFNGGMVGFQSGYFRIESTGKFHKAAVKVTAIVSRNQNREITVYHWRVEDVRPESSQDVAWTNVM